MLVLYIFIAVLVYFFITDIKTFLICIVIFYPTLFLIPSIGSISFISIIAYCSLLYCLLFPKKRYNQRDPFPFKLSFSLCLLSYLMSSVYNTFSIGNLINCTSDFVLIISMWYLLKPDVKLEKNFTKVLTCYIILLCSYGAYEAISGNNPIIQELVDIGRLEQMYTKDNSYRTGFFRTKSLTIWCEVYGVICYCAIFVYTNHFFQYKNRNKILLLVLLLLLFFSVISTNSRTIWVATAIILASTILYIRKKTSYLLSFVLLILLIVLCNQDYFFNTFIKPIVNINSSGGSSLELRTMQFKTSLIAVHNIWFGNGINAYSKAQDIFSSLYGVESILFTTLIDRGIWGLVSLLILWCDIIWYIVRKHQFKMLFLLAGYVFTKIATLTYGLSEIYVLMFIIVLMRIDKYNNSIIQNLSEWFGHIRRSCRQKEIDMTR